MHTQTHTHTHPSEWEMGNEKEMKRARQTTTEIIYTMGNSRNGND